MPKFFGLNRYLFKILSVLLLLSASALLHAQPIDNQNVFSISYHDGQSLQTNQLIQLWAINNGNSVYDYHWSIPYHIRCKPEALSDGRTKIIYTLTHKTINGKTLFRDFRMGNLLIPDSARFAVSWWIAGKKVDGGSFVGVFGNGEQVINSSKVMVIGKAKCKLRLLDIRYSSAQLHKIFAQAALVNHYYGYMEVMRTVAKWVNQRANGLRPDPWVLFVAEQKLLRIKALVHQHKLIHVLQLSKTDPKQFIKKFAAINRLLLRMQSLSRQHFHDRITDKSEGKMRFIKGYLAISTDALSQVTRYQPYISSSFHEFAALPDTIGFLALAKMAGFYDKRDESHAQPVLLQLYEGFITAASSENEKNNFVDATLLLENAAQLAKGFASVPTDIKWKRERIRAMEGMAVSFLKVAQSALARFNTNMAHSYQVKATSVMDGVLKDTAFRKFRFDSYTRALLTLANRYYHSEQYEQSFLLLKQMKKASRDALLPEQRNQFDELAKNLRNHYLLLCSSAIKSKQFEDAAENLQAAIQIHSAFRSAFQLSYTKDSEMLEMVQRLYDFLLTDAKEQFEQGQFTRVSRLINAARALQQQFNMLPEQAWASLSKKALIPYIKDKMNQAAFQIWAHRPAVAIGIYRQADSLSRVFQINDEEEVKQAFTRLKAKMDVAQCEMDRNQWENLNTKARYMLRNHRLIDAVGLFRKAWLLTTKEEGANCFTSALQDSTKQLFHLLAEFATKQQAFTTRLFRVGIYAVIPQYVALDQAYRAARLNQLGYPYTNLYQFVNQQETDALVRAVIDYFVNKEDFQQAFRYLKLLHHSKVNAKVLYTYQKRIARGFAEKGLAVSESKSDEPWVNDFRLNLEKFRKHLAE